MSREQAINILGEEATEDQIKRLMGYVPETVEGDGVDDTAEEDDTDEGDETSGDDNSNSNFDNTDDEEDSEELDFESLSDEGKMLFNMFQKDKKKTEVKNMRRLIQSSNVDITYKEILTRLSRSLPEEEIIALIEREEEVSRSIARKAGKTKIVPKGNIYKKVNMKFNKALRVGSREFGASLAK